MKISLQQTGKKFQKHWIFRKISAEFPAHGKVALLGHNGSGKSTLLRMIAGMQNPSEGRVLYFTDEGTPIPADKVYSHISFCAPAQELVEELTLTEFFDFHFSFKKPVDGLSATDIIGITGLQQSAEKTIGDYSSGMKQRVKLAQAIFSDTPVLMLDEPCTNLDQNGVEQYRDWMERYAKDRMVIVASNDVREHFFCEERIELEQFKQK